MIQGIPKATGEVMIKISIQEALKLCWVLDNRVQPSSAEADILSCLAGDLRELFDHQYK